MQVPLHVGGVEIRPGQRVTIDLPVTRLHTHIETTMPVQVIHSTRPGPRLFISAVVHGDEINGVEIVRRLLKL
jgi:predicted deacylase